MLFLALPEIAMTLIMIIHTLIEQRNKLTPATVEIELLPGIPQIHFLGLPDQVIKESFFRIKAALKSSGFTFPVAHQVIVNIQPNSLKKSSSGLELAVALGILHLTDQKTMTDSLQQHIIYGELDLNGSVREPENLITFNNHHQQLILTGSSSKQKSSESPSSQINYSRITHLTQDALIDYNQKSSTVMIRPSKGLTEYYSPHEAELIFLMSTTGLHTLIAGQAGAGKSFLAKNYTSFINTFSKTPHSGELWFPSLSPHHSLTLGAFLGGGVQLCEGELEKVKNGLLILDELLEFNPLILESLREPMTGETLRLARAGRVKEITPDFQIVATSNFCPCGKWIPSSGFISCRFAVAKCKGYLNKLSGPLVDRFGLMFFHTNTHEKRSLSGHDILNRIDNFNDLTKTNPVVSTFDQELLENLYGHLSQRRFNALIKVAQIYAIEEKSPYITINHIKKSEKWTVTSFLMLEKGIC
ncbi:MAG: ATP-binding protein [Pseudobdellovibrio sp.]